MNLRIVLWPRGDFFFSSQLPGIVSELTKCDVFGISCKIVWTHGYYRKSFRIKYKEWIQMANELAQLSEECAIAIFLSAIQISGSYDTYQFYSSHISSFEVELLVIICILIRLSAENSKEFVNHIKNNIDSFCALLLICEQSMLDKYVHTPEFSTYPNIDSIEPKGLKNFDLLFEGTIIQYSEKSKISCSQISTMTCSEIFLELWPHISNFKFNDITRFIKKKVQHDMFALNDNPLINRDTPRRITLTRLAKHRKLTVCNWTRMELLTNPLYRGANLRIFNGTSKSSWVFHPQFLQTALIKNCNGCRPIVIGPVKDLVLISNAKNCFISVICKRMIISESVNLVIFVNTPTTPVVVGHCENIQFAPYNVYYDMLEVELKKAELNLLNNQDNCFNKPMQINRFFFDTTGQIKTNITSTFKLISNKFYLQFTPFQSTNFYKNSQFLQDFQSSIDAQYWNNWQQRINDIPLYYYNLVNHQSKTYNNFIDLDDYNYVFKKILKNI